MLFFFLKSIRIFRVNQAVPYRYYSRDLFILQVFGFERKKLLRLISLLKKDFCVPFTLISQEDFRVPGETNYFDLFTCIGETRRQQAIQTRNQIPTPHQSRPTMKYQVCRPINHCSGSVKSGYGSGTADLYLHWITDPDPDPASFFRCQLKICFFS